MKSIKIVSRDKYTDDINTLTIVNVELKYGKYFVNYTWDNWDERKYICSRTFKDFIDTYKPVVLK